MEDWTDLFKKHPKQELGFYEPKNLDKHNLSKNVDNKARQDMLRHKFKKLKHHITYLNMEYEDVAPIFKLAQNTFIKTMIEYCKRQKIEAPFESYTPKKNKNKNNLKQAKDLYREIAKKTHPDKTKDLSNEEVDFRADLYREATEGKVSGDFNKILKVALDLDIEINCVSIELIDSIQKEIIKMDKKISKMKSDIMYKWYYTDPQGQKKIFEQLTKNQKPIEPQ